MPTVSVILPVYNAERFLKEAVDSLLAQTFTDFELLLLNDGSTDGSEAIMSSYKDPRVRLVNNETNKGLVYTLNRGIALAMGQYLARMDADDRAYPTRLEKQVQWLNQNPATAVVATFSTQIDENGNEVGFSARDRKTVTAAEIRRAMPWDNCLTHPSVMGRTEVFKAFRYSPSQQHIEDYDLWLRLLSHGHRIDKIPEPLLFYRTHALSVTQTKLRRRNFFIKHFYCKRRYLAHQIRNGHYRVYDATVALAMLADAAKAGAKALKALISSKR